MLQYFSGKITNLTKIGAGKSKLFNMDNTSEITMECFDIEGFVEWIINFIRNKKDFF